MSPGRSRDSVLNLEWFLCECIGWYRDGTAIAQQKAQAPGQREAARGPAVGHASERNAPNDDSVRTDDVVIVIALERRRDSLELVGVRGRSPSAILFRVWDDQIR
jgi:hypothetical protein